MSKKIWIFLSILVSGILILFFMEVVSPMVFFRNYICNPVPESVKNIKYAKDHGVMRGANIFLFTADSEDIKIIINKCSLHKYSDYKEIPEATRSIIENRFTKVAWWPVSQLRSMSMYGKILESQYEWTALFLFINSDGKSYVIKI